MNSLNHRLISETVMKISRDIETVPTSNPPKRASAAIDPDMAKLAFAFGKYLIGLLKTIIFCYFIINSTRNKFH